MGFLEEHILHHLVKFAGGFALVGVILMFLASPPKCAPEANGGAITPYECHAGLVSTASLSSSAPGSLILADLVQGLVLGGAIAVGVGAAWRKRLGGEG